MADTLMPEILDRIFYYLGRWGRFEIIPRQYRRDLYSASLVCRKWSVSASRLTHRCVTLRRDGDLQRFCQYIVHAAERRSHIEYLEVDLYSLLVRKRDRLLSLRVLHVAPQLYCLKELHVATHKWLADTGLAYLIAGLPNIHTLSLEHYTGDPAEMPQRTYADATWLYSALPHLPKLRNLFMERFRLPSLPNFPGPPSRLVQLAFNDCIIEESSLHWIVSGGSLTHLGLARLAGISQNGLVQVFETIGADLTHLILVLDCRNSIMALYHLMDVPTFLSQSPYSGVANRVVQLCPNLVALDMQELGLDPMALTNCRSLNRLRVTIIDPIALLKHLGGNRHSALNTLWLYSPIVHHKFDEARKANLKVAFAALGIAKVTVEHYWAFEGDQIVRNAFGESLPLM